MKILTRKLFSSDFFFRIQQTISLKLENELSEIGQPRSLYLTSVYTGFIQEFPLDDG